MTTTEHPAKAPSAKTGLFATLRACGSGAPLSRSLTRLVLAAACLSLIASAALLTAPASADPAPTLTVNAPTEASYTTAHVSGEVNPNGGPSETLWEFQYSADPEEGWNASGGLLSAGSGSAAVPVEETLTGLHPNTTYFVRLFAFNEEFERITVTEAPYPSFITEAVAKPTVSIDPVTTFTGTTARFSGHINPNAPAGNPPAFDVSWRFQCIPDCGSPSGELAADNASHEVSAEATGLQPGTPYEVSLIAENAGGEETAETAGPVSFATPAIAPAIDSTSVSAVTTSGATLNAQINPGAAATTFHFEYVTQEQFEKEEFENAEVTPESVSIGSDNEDHQASATVAGLAPDTSYDYRVVATNSAAPSGIDGPTKTFATYPTALASSGCSNETLREENDSTTLPDCRAYEMVTPVKNQDANVYVPDMGTGGGEGINTRYPFQASLNGNAIAYVGDPSPTGNGDSGNGGGNQYIATRTPEGGWTQLDVAPAPPKGSTGPTVATWPTYLAFSDDLSFAVLDSPQPLSADAPTGYQDLYLRANGNGRSYRPFFTAIPPHRAPSGESFRTADGYEVGVKFAELLYAGASSDFTHLLFEANDTLAPNAIDGGEEENNLYDSVDGGPQLVNVLPDGTSEPNAIFGAPPVGVSPQRNPPALGHVISTDGSRIFWTDLNTEVTPEDPAGARRLFVRENDAASEECAGPGEPAKACTLQLDASQAPEGLGATETQEREERSGGGRFWTASADGSRVFFTDESKLTEGSTAAPGEPDLYEYNFAKSLGERLTDLTVDANAGEHANVQGVIGASEDGSYLYFVADGALAPGATPQTCEPVESAGQEGTPCNLYVLHRGEQPKFIAVLSSADNLLEQVEGGQAGDWGAGLGARTAEVTPDGHHLVFGSRQSLTGYPNEARPEVYTYDADTGRLFCASCDPSGAPPPFTEADVFFNSAGGRLPVGWSATHQQRWISDDGSRVFFDSADPLVPQDVNGHQDVYEWEREGSGGCAAKSPARANGGCIYLLSGGTASSNAHLIDSSPSGEDVFFATRAQLAPQDRNGNFDLYDARVGGGSPVPTQLPPCEVDGCRGPLASPPSLQSPGTSVFSGPGNPPPSRRCRKGFVHKRSDCIKQHHKKRHRVQRSHKRAAHTDRRASQ